MESFPRTSVDSVSTSRMIIGTNWFLRYTHRTAAKSTSVERIVTNAHTIADTIMCLHTRTCMFDAIREAEQCSDVIMEYPYEPSVPAFV